VSTQLQNKEKYGIVLFGLTLCISLAIPVFVVKKGRGAP
jgi:hypothetical protein